MVQDCTAQADCVTLRIRLPQAKLATQYQVLSFERPRETLLIGCAALRERPLDRPALERLRSNSCYSSHGASSEAAASGGATPLAFA